jgi:hypothetical protein
MPKVHRKRMVTLTGELTRRFLRTL